MQKWSKKLARSAQTWANQCDCVFKASSVYPCSHGGTTLPNGKSAGQNIAWYDILVRMIDKSELITSIIC